MAPIDPTTLPGMPAPFWFVEFFKVLGFTLHMVPMNLWYAGVVLAVGLHAWGPREGKRFASRLMVQMPILVALGINFGIVPLLFTQLAYSKAFYPATILMAWPWLAIVALLIPAYYGVYLYAWGVRRPEGLPRWAGIAGWVSAGLFVAIGFLFANGFSLMANPPAWPALWMEHSVGGAATGIALNLADPSLWPRWLLMFGLALLTTSAWSVVDAAFFAGGETTDYRRWVQGFAWKLAAVGLAWIMVSGAWYSLGTWPRPVRAAMFHLPWGLLTLLTAAAPLVPPALLWGTRRAALTRAVALSVAAAQIGVLALNAVSRQVVQNIEVARLVDVSRQPLDVQLGPLVLFLAVFLGGLVVVGWMIRQVVAASSPQVP